MSGIRFRQLCTNLAKQIYPDIDGEALIAESQRIHTYLTKNGSQNLVSLKSMSTDVLSFAETLHLNGYPFALRGYQRDLLSDWQADNDSLVVHARGMGISTLLAIYTLWVASFGENVRIGFVCGSSKSITNNMHMLQTLHYSSTLTLPKFEASARSMRFDNGNIVSFLSPSTYGHGISLTHLLVDETHAVGLKDDDNIYSLFLLTSGQVIMAGTPNVNVGIFHELCTSHAWFTNLKTFLPFTEHPDYDEAWEANMRANMGYKDFEAAYNLTFSKVFDSY